MTSTDPAAITAGPPAPIERDARAEWALDPDIAYLNHGSFGARPRCVHEARLRWLERFEASPFEWLDRQGPELLDRAKAAVGRFIGAEPANFGFVTNTTEGINAVLRSRRLAPGDEILITDHEYPGIRHAVHFAAARTGAKVTEVPIPLPVADEEEIIAAIESGLTPATRLLVIDHITSPTAIVFPIGRIVELCRERGVDVAVDGAHAPGMVELDLERLGAMYYAANLHKWLSAPMGAAVLWVVSDKQADLHPVVISNFHGEGFPREFAWQGTRDVTPWLVAEDAIAFGERIGWDRIRLHNHELAVWVQQMLCRRWSGAPLSPLDGSMLGSMAALELPGEPWRLGDRQGFVKLLYERYRIEAPVQVWNGRWLIRPSCHIYNRAEEYERLADAVLELLG